MMKKLFVVFILTLLIASVIFPVTGFNYKELEKQGMGNDSDWWPQFQYDPENTGFTTSPGPETNNILWAFKAKHEFSIRGSVIVDGRVYAGTFGTNLYHPHPEYIKNNYSGWIYCLDANTGDLIWQRLSRYGLQCEPAVADGKLYVCSGLWYYSDDDIELQFEGDVYCLNAEDGSLVWEVLDCGYVEGGPIVAEGKLFFSVYKPKSSVKCLDAETGEEIWNCSLKGPRGTVAVSNGKVYVGVVHPSWPNTEKLFCLNASTGETIWSWDEKDPEEIRAAPTVVDGKVYVATKGYGYIGPNGTTRIYGEVHCLDAETGELLWESDTEESYAWCSPAVAYGKVYIGSGKYNKRFIRGRFYCLNASDGSLVWKRRWLFHLGFLRSFTGCYSPAIADGKVYFGCTDFFSANLYCLDAFTGETIWKYFRPAWWGSFYQPAIADGKLYVGFENIKPAKLSSHAWLYCFGD